MPYLNLTLTISGADFAQIKGKISTGSNPAVHGAAVHGPEPSFNAGSGEFP
jgi:hypothetical protein